MHIDLYSSIAGINAFFRKMDVSANNVANMNTDNYKRRVAEIGQNENGHPPKGPPREMSNVNYAEEAVSMIETKIGAHANVKALQTAEDMLASIIDIIA